MKKDSTTKKTSRKPSTKQKVKPELNYPQQLEALKVDDSDLDDFARYFGIRFEHDTEDVTVLVALLKRISATIDAHGTGGTVHPTDVIARLIDRLYAKSESGEHAAQAFAAGANAK